MGPTEVVVISPADHESFQTLKGVQPSLITAFKTLFGKKKMKTAAPKNSADSGDEEAAEQEYWTLFIAFHCICF